MAFAFENDRLPNLLVQDADGSGNIRPEEIDSGFIYHQQSKNDKNIFEYLNQKIFDGTYPVSDYESISNNVFVVYSENEMDEALSNHPPNSLEITTVILNHNPNRISVSNQEEYVSVLVIGEKFKEILKELNKKSNTKQFSYGLDQLLGYDYSTQLNSLIKEGRLTIEGLDNLASHLKLNSVINSFTSCAKYFYSKAKQKGYLFHSIDELIHEFFSVENYGGLVKSIKGIVLNQGSKPDLFGFAKKGQEKIDEIINFFESMASYLPSIDFLLDFFWESFDAMIATNQEVHDFLRKLFHAKNRFEKAMYKSGGTEIYNQLFGPKGKQMLDDSGKHIELMIGGGLFGTIPFLFGTIYQIIYDIVNLITNLCWYAYWGTAGALSWLFKPDETKKKDMVKADESLLEMFTFNFDLNELPQTLSKIFGKMASLIKLALDNFIENAKEYGKTAGKIMGELITTMASGTLSLMTSGYPKKPTLWNRFTYIIKQWFSIGCILGPILVDIILLFCSGGVSGIFSAASKLGKLDKVGDVMKYGFRFYTKTKKIIASSGFYKKFDALIPKALKDLLQNLLEQLWAITSSLPDFFKVLFNVVNEKLAKAGKAIKKK